MIKSNFKNSAFFILRFTLQIKPFLFDLKEMCNFKYFPKTSKKNIRRSIEQRFLSEVCFKVVKSLLKTVKAFFAF